MIKNHENFTNTVQLADGDYLAVLGVYHQLHCLVSTIPIISRVSEDCRVDAHPEHLAERRLSRLLQAQNER